MFLNYYFLNIVLFQLWSDKYSWLDGTNKDDRVDKLNDFHQYRLVKNQYLHIMCVECRKSKLD